jgi:hypothetical protein
MKAITINRAFGLGLIAQDGVLCKDRAEFEWRNRRVRRRQRALEHARIIDYYRRMAESVDMINDVLAKWDTGGRFNWYVDALERGEDIILKREVFPDGSVGPVRRVR